MKKKVLIFLALLVTVQLFSGCAFLRQTEGSSVAPAPSQAEKRSAWVAYWAVDDAMAEVADLGDSLESLLYFGAYFDAQDRLFIPDAIVQFKAQVERTYGAASPGPAYLTFINDKLLAQGGSSLKDTALLYTLLETPDARRAHIADILALTEGGGYDGVEIDYEAMRRDMVLWEHFINFITELTEQTQQRGLLLRVVLEPGIPYEALVFPEGPEYVIMCYNLHGPGSEPGPKADDAFLLELVKKTANLPGRRHFALATGGFEWVGTSVTTLSQKEAFALSRQEKAAPQRDADSQAVSFAYRGPDGVVHQVWYADAITLTHWMSLIRGAGDFGITLWRLCG